MCARQVSNSSETIFLISLLEHVAKSSVCLAPVNSHQIGLLPALLGNAQGIIMKMIKSTLIEMV